MAVKIRRKNLSDKEGIKGWEERWGEETERREEQKGGGGGRKDR